MSWATDALQSTKPPGPDFAGFAKHLQETRFGNRAAPARGPRGPKSRTARYKLGRLIRLQTIVFVSTSILVLPLLQCISQPEWGTDSLGNSSLNNLEPATEPGSLGQLQPFSFSF
ncbi:hypothetical protein VTK26DRAFT_5058 [Humicola hyalothermophila]